MAHSQVAAHAGGALLAAGGAADVLDLLGQGLEGAVDLVVAVAHHVGVVGAVVAAAAAVGIGGLLLQGLADEVEAAAGGSGGARGSGETGSTLRPGGRSADVNTALLRTLL